MMTSDDILTQFDLRHTKVRQDILDLFLSTKEALSTRDIDKNLPNLDRITLYRNLKIFEALGVIHSIRSADQLMYALCSEGCSSTKHLDDHVHFYCTQCHRTLCLDQIQIPAVQLPKDYEAESNQLLVSGICDSCEP